MVQKHKQFSTMPPQTFHHFADFVIPGMNKRKEISSLRFVLCTRFFTAFFARHLEIRRDAARRLRRMNVVDVDFIANVAEVLFIDEATVRNWLAKYRQGSVEELLTLYYQGQAVVTP
ncbi:MAG: hypothetical protein FWH27_19540 [Planctomycetaceae bacterium]|nr:hypothetical protein [Planctomycetaceae bacterium]